MTDRRPRLRSGRSTELSIEIVKRLARAQARGWRQASLVNELLTGPVRVTPQRIPGNWVDLPRYTNVYGLSELPHSSFRPLRARLVAAGFVLKLDREINTVTMTFPEGDSL